MASMSLAEYERYSKLEDIMDELEPHRRSMVLDLADALVKEQREIRGLQVTVTVTANTSTDD